MGKKESNPSERRSLGQQVIDEETVETHESFGTICISRQSGGGLDLFGSSVKHHESITIRISRAERKRALHRDWIHSTTPLVEVVLSPVQFADAITHLNFGDGTPCTLDRVAGKQMPPCPAYTQREQFEKEFEGDVKRVTAEAAEIGKEVVGKLRGKGQLSAADRKELADQIDQLLMHVRSNMPFVHKQFNEAMEKTVGECKGEVEAFITSKVHRLGLEALAETMPRLPSVEEPKPLPQEPRP
jgi:hypothetical protein